MTAAPSRSGPFPFPFALVGFDCDGTLLDTHLDLAAALNHALALAGRAPVAPEVARTLIGGGTTRMLERGLALTGGPVPDDRFERLLDGLFGFYEDHIAVHTRLYPGGAAMLDALAERDVKLAVASNKIERLTVKLLDALGLTQRFAAVIGGDTLGPGHAKPAPDLLLEMARRCDLPTGARTAYVGDTSFDTRGARAAGMPCVLCTFGFTDAPLSELGAVVTIDHFAALVPTLERL